MLTAILIILIVIALMMIIATFGLAEYLRRLINIENDNFEILTAVIGLRGMIRKLSNFVENEYQRAASANGMFREQAAEAKATLANHMAGCHADDPKPEDTPAFTNLIDEQATNKVADLFEALGVSPDEIAAATDTIQGEVTQILNGHGVTVFHNEGATFDDQGEITSLLGIPVVAESGPEDIYPDEELPFEDEEDDFTRCERINLGRHRYNEHGRCTECDADAVEQGDADPEDEDEQPSEDQPMSQEYEKAVWPGHTERTTL